MANQEQLVIIRQGIAAWNEWRKQHPRDSVDLTGVQLRDAYLQGADLHGARLEGARLSKANLQSADLQGANLQGARLDGADLRKAVLDGVNLQYVDLTEADLSGAHIIGTNLDQACLSKANLNGANLRDSDLSRSTLRDASLVGADFTNTNLSDANLQGVKYSLKEMSGKCIDVRTTGCFGNSVFIKNLRDQQYIDAVIAGNKTLLGRISIYFWHVFTDYGRDLWRYFRINCLLILLFGIIYWAYSPFDHIYKNTIWASLYDSVTIFTIIGFNEVKANDTLGFVCKITEVSMGWSASFIITNVFLRRRD